MSIRPSNFALSLVFVALLGSACTGLRSTQSTQTSETLVGRSIDDRRTVTLLTVNDIYRIEGVDEGTAGGLARLRALRADLEQRHPDLLLLHAGDFLFPSLLSDEYDGAQMIDLMNRLDGSAEDFDPRFFVTFGNHEFDEARLHDAPLLQERIDDSQFRWLGTDLEWAEDDSGRPLITSSNFVRSELLESAGVRIGLYSVTTDEKHPEYVTQFRDPIATSRQATKDLRERGAELVIALTHQALPEDLALLDALAAPEGPDLIIGGHEHQRIAERSEDGRWVIKADADGRTAAFVQITLGAEDDDLNEAFDVRHDYLPLDLDVEPDPDLAARTEYWIETHQREYCAGIDRPNGCLDQVIGQTAVRLRAEETEIRRWETNLGNWVADQAKAVFPSADAALINAGSLRLNQDIPAGPIRVRSLEELFAYPNKLVLLEIDGETLRRALERAVFKWTGDGAFLQVSGIAFRFDPGAMPGQRVSDITLLANGQAIDADDTLRVVTWDFLHGGGDDYDMWTEVEAETSPLDMSKHIREVIEGLDAPLAPRVEGRICNPQRPGPCLAVDTSQ